MKPILFITGNAGKLREVRALIPGVQGVDMDLTEIQEIDAHKIIAAKLVEAQRYQSGAFMVEDTSLYLDAMNGLPGPLVKWFLKTVGIEGIYKLSESFGSVRATACTIIGYADEDGNLLFFEGSIEGILVPPRGADGFGWDPLFQPDGYQKTFAEMTPEEKKQCSMRRLAVKRLRRHLEQEGKANAQ
jgi:inosine triphosphate pyrophosphatase